MMQRKEWCVLIIAIVLALMGGIYRQSAGVKVSWIDHPSIAPTDSRPPEILESRMAWSINEEIWQGTVTFSDNHL